MKPRRPTIAAMLFAAIARTWPADAFMPMQRMVMSHFSAFFRLYTQHPSNRLHQRAKRRRHQSSLPAIGIGDETKPNATKKVNPRFFVDDVISFLEIDGISWRQVSQRELRNVLSLSLEQHPQNGVAVPSNRVDEMMMFLDDRVILAVGRGNGDTMTTTATNTTPNRTLGQQNYDTDNAPSINSISEETFKSNRQTYSYILHLCPTPNLDAIQKMHQQHDHNSTVSQALSAYAWLNTHLTNAFFNYDLNQLRVSSDHDSRPKTTIVHLHQDVWNRSPSIAQSRLRNKCGIYNQRIYARQTIVKRIPKSEYIPFLEKNHLWGATGAKSCYGLFWKPKRTEHLKQQNNNTRTLQSRNQDEMLVAVASFSSKRKINRSNSMFHSFGLLRFCTKLDTTVVGGLTKLVAAFVKGVKSKHTDTGIDIITSVDRDFGSNTWPKFEQMDVMDPVPMFVGDVDGLRRHAVGAGLTPLDQNIRNNTSMTPSMLLRAGLPESLLWKLQHDSLHKSHDRDWPWQTAAQQGFHPVFDAGVERLMMVADNIDTTNLSLSELWGHSTPCYVNEHYSQNAGIDNMLKSIRQYRS
mmetsp:Transcript_28977/g.69845  ORF Transcript_28977/g.69845 Transcript_28977/m.69845 type:complete len:578 (-) Transcript_28977:277-2010(-)